MDATRSVRHHCVVDQVNRHHVVARLCERARTHLMEANPELVPVGVDTQVAIIRVIVLLEKQLLRLDRGFLRLKIVHTATRVRLLGGVPLARAHYWIDVVTAVAANDKRYVISLFANLMMR